MTNPATALSTASREPDRALRSVLERLADDSGRHALAVGSFEALCRLVVQTVRETVLQRTYHLKSEGHDGLYMTISNRRLLSLYDAGSEVAELLPDLPSSDVADVVVDRLRAVCSSASAWSISLSGQGTPIFGSAGSCSADMLLSRLKLGADIDEATSVQSPRILASLQIPAGSEPDITQGDPLLISALRRISVAFTPSPLAPSVTGTVFPRRATLIPLSQDHVALLSEAGLTIVLEAYQMADMTRAAQAWVDRERSCQSNLS